MDDQTGNPVSGLATVTSSLQGWASVPFKSTMSLTGWFLWVGLIIVAAAIWFQILHEVDV